METPNISMVDYIMNGLLSEKEDLNISRNEILNIMKFAFPEDQTTVVTGYLRFKYMVVFVLPVLFIFGILGNVVSFLIFQTDQMKKLSTSILLSSLAVADTIVLIIGLLPEWCGLLTGFNIQTMSSSICKVVNFILYSTGQISVWLLVAITVERYVVVCHSHRAKAICVKSKIKNAVVFIIVCICAINSHTFWTIDLITQDTVETETYVCQSKIISLTWLDACLYAIIPSLIIFVINILIICSLVRKIAHPFKNKSKSTKRSEIKLTVVSIVVSLTFVITVLPICVVLILTAYWSANKNEQVINILWIIHGVTDVLMYLNHSINFLLYSVMGTKFRKILFSKICPGFYKPKTTSQGDEMPLRSLSISMRTRTETELIEEHQTFLSSSTF